MNNLKLNLECTIKTMLYAEGYAHWHYEQMQYTVFSVIPTIIIYHRYSPYSYLLQRYFTKKERRSRYEQA